ncbi:hypothetical protein Tco_1476439 [Tanacetum coccineum]
MSPPPSHEPEFQASRSSEESEQLRNLMDIVPRLNQDNILEELTRKQVEEERKSKETKDAQGQDQDVPSQTDQGDTFATPEKSKGSGEAQEEQISPSTLEAAQILTNKETESKPTPTKILHFEEPDESQVNTGSTLSVGYTAALNTGETEKVQRRKGKDPMTEEDLQAEVQASKKSKELQELADLEEAQRVQAKMDAETQRQIDLDALLARRLVEQEEEAAREALATEFDYIQARLNADQILAEKIQQEEREQYSIEERAKFLHDTIAAQRKFLAEQRSVFIRNVPPTYLSSEIRWILRYRSKIRLLWLLDLKKMKEQSKMNENDAEQRKKRRMNPVMRKFNKIEKLTVEITTVPQVYQVGDTTVEEFEILMLMTQSHLLMKRRRVGVGYPPQKLVFGSPCLTDIRTNSPEQSAASHDCPEQTATGVNKPGSDENRLDTL